MSRISTSQEDYLEAIYILQQKHKEVRVTDLAAELSLSKPSANRAVALLKNAKLVLHEKYGTITLTPEGEEAGRAVYFRHKILRHFLMDNLGVPEKIAEEDACKIEHVISPITLQKFVEYSKKSSPSKK